MSYINYVYYFVFLLTKLASLNVSLIVFRFHYILCRVVEFGSKDDMKNALKKLDDSEFFGRRIILKVVSSDKLNSLRQ